jgi:hypothetical protein
LFNKQWVARGEVLGAMISSPPFAALSAHAAGCATTFFKKLYVMAKLGEPNRTA